MGDNNFKDLDNSDFIVGGGKSNINNIIRNQRLSPNMSPNLNSSNNTTPIGNIGSGNINNSINNSNNSQNNTPNSIRTSNNNINNSNNNNSLNPTNNSNNDKNINSTSNDNNNSILHTSISQSSDLSDLPPISANYGHSTSHFDSKFDHNYTIKDRQCSSYADRVLFSNKYYYSYVFMILINLILIIWLITNLIRKNTSVPSHWAFILLDILVNVTLSIEIVLQIISQKRKYFQTWANIFDLFVLVISVGGLFLYFHSTSESYDYESVVIIFLTAIRYFFQFLRLIALINRQKLKKSTFNSRIDFTELRETDIDFDIDSADDF